MSMKYAEQLGMDRKRGQQQLLLTAAIVVICLIALGITGFFDAQRFIDGAPAMKQLGSEMIPPIEHVDPKPMEAAAAAGASRFQIIVFSVLPQVLPQLADITIYRWEYHFRASAVLGIVGAGGYWL